MRRLPNVNQLVAQVTQQAAEAQVGLQKQASAPVPEYTVPVARDLVKAAAQCRAGAVNVTVGDVEAFAQRLKG